MSDEESSIISHTRFAAFAYPAFSRYWTARFCSTFAVQIVSVAVGWQIYDLTRNPMDLGIIGLVQFLPLLLLVLVTGSVADRFGRRRVMGIAVLLETICAAAILYFSIRGLTSPLPIFVALTGMGIARAFFGPASQSLVVNLVPLDVFANAISWNASAWQVSSIVGPVAGGLLYGLNPDIAYSVVVIMLLLAFILITRIDRKSVV